MTGQRLGRYRLERLLGQGGMGQVWLAHTEPAGGRPGGRVALKLLPAELAADQTYRSRFEREAELAARLHDSHIVPIDAHGALDGRLFIEMEFVEGDDLGRTLRTSGALPPVRAVDIVAQTATALDAAHRAGLVHRDVKPSNIVVRRDGFAYLIDFGIARGADSAALTASGLAVGTWAYMAPERFTGHSDARADIYSLGCVLYECLAGVRPFGATDPARQMHDHLTTTPPSVRALVPGIPAELDRVIARAMAKEPGDRYRSAGDFARAATAALAGTATTVLAGTATAQPGTASAADPAVRAAEHPGTRHYEADDRPEPAAAHPGTRAYTEHRPGEPVPSPPIGRPGYTPTTRPEGRRILPLIRPPGPIPGWRPGCGRATPAARHRPPDPHRTAGVAAVPRSPRTAPRRTIRARRPVGAHRAPAPERPGAARTDRGGCCCG